MRHRLKMLIQHTLLIVGMSLFRLDGLPLLHQEAYYTLNFIPDEK